MKSSFRSLYIGAELPNQMASCGLEIIVDQGAMRRPTLDSDVLGNLLDILDKKCLDHCALPISYSPSLSTVQGTRKRKAIAPIDESVSIKRVHEPKRVCFSPTSSYRVVAEHRNSNDYRMSNGILDDTHERASLVIRTEGAEEDLVEDESVEDNDSLDEFAGAGSSEEDGGDEGCEGAAEPAARTLFKSCRKAKDVSEDSVEDKLPFEDKEILTKEEDGPSNATIAAQVHLAVFVPAVYFL